MKYLFLFSLFLLSWQSEILTSHTDGIILESGDSSSDSSDSDLNRKYYSQDESSAYKLKPKNKSYTVEQKRKKLPEQLNKSDIAKELNLDDDSNHLTRIVNHVTEHVLLNDRELKGYINDFFLNKFKIFRALFVLPDEKNILSDLHRTLITNLELLHLQTIVEQTNQTDLRLQLWTFTQLMDIHIKASYNYANENYLLNFTQFENIYKKSTDKENGKSQEESQFISTRNLIINLGKKIDIVWLPGKSGDDSTRSTGVDYVGLVFKSINLINYLPNATEESYALTKLLNDIKLKLNKYHDRIRKHTKKNNNQDFTSNILQGYSRFTQTRYPTEFHILESVITSIHNEIKHTKKRLITKERAIFFLIAVCSGVLANYGITKTFIWLKRIKKKIQASLAKAESDS